MAYCEAAGSTERAFGELTSNSLSAMICANFTNDTSAVILSLMVSYTGEQWRRGSTSADQWTDVTAANNYYFELQKADGTLVHRKWYAAATYCSGLNCVITPSIGTLPVGDYKWRILDYGAYGTWTGYLNFTLSQ